MVAVSLAFIAVFVFTYNHRLTSARGDLEQPAKDDLAMRDRAIALAIRPASLAREPGLTSSRSLSEQVPVAVFGICYTGGGQNCVVDGDTAWIGGEKIRVADIDAPETHPPRCPSEADLGARATKRLAELMNAGPFELRTIGRDTDRYGRKLRVLMRHGRSIGDQLVEEGLARTWEGRRRPWC